MTRAQAHILREINRFMVIHKYTPSITEIATAAGSTRQTVSYHLRNLERLGYVVRAGKWNPHGLKIVRNPFA